jgi:glucokinase
MKPQTLVGLDLGGTKCAAVLGGLREDGSLQILGKLTYATATYPGPQLMLGRLQEAVNQLLSDHCIPARGCAAIGVSCGGPLDSKRGLIRSPPNLPGWDEVEIVRILSERFGIPAGIQNDANACALAEWKFGAGRGTRNMVFLTFGTGMGAGLILDGRLYAGTNDNAGEVGHLRMAPAGPMGYGKAGSFEGFCSGGGIAQLARAKAIEWLGQGKAVSFCTGQEDLTGINAHRIAEAARRGDPLALEIFAICGDYLGRGLAVLVDILNPECIVIGSIFVRAADLLVPSLEKALAAEALPLARQVCRVVPAAFDEELGDLAALSVAASLVAGPEEQL